MNKLSPEHPSELLYSLPQAAAILGISRQYLHRMIRAGRVPSARQIGRAWVIRPPVAIEPRARRHKNK